MSRREGTDRRRRALLDAALACFIEFGVAGATLDDVRVRAGASIGSLYHHYPSKAHLAEALYVEALRSYADAWSEVLDRTTSAERGVKRVVRAHFRWIAEHPSLARFLFSATSGPGLGQVQGVDSAKAREAFDTHHRNWIDARSRDGAFRRFPPGVAEALWIGPSQTLTRQWIAWEHLDDLERFAPELAAAAWEALRPD